MGESAESQVLDKKDEFKTFPGFCNVKCNHMLLLNRE